MAGKNRGAVKGILVAHLVFLMCQALYGPVVDAALEETAGEILQKYSRLPTDERKRALEDGAKQEGRFVFYGVTSADDARKYLDAFRKRYSFLSIGHYRSGGAPLLSKILSEYRGGKREADVIDISATPAFLLAERGLIDPYFPQERSSIRSEFISPKGLWVGFNHYLLVLGYNTRLVKPADVPRSYDELLNPKWTSAISLDSTDYDWLYMLANQWGDAKATEFLRRLVRLKPRIVRGHQLQAQLLAAGEFSIAAVLYDYRVRQIKAQGAPIDATLLNPAMTRPAVLMLARQAPHPHAAALFIDWALSAEGQGIVESEFKRHSVRQDMGKGFDQAMKGQAFKVMTPEATGPKSDHYIKVYKELIGQ